MQNVFREHGEHGSFESFKAAQKFGWAHFAPLEAFTTSAAAQLVKHAKVRAGQRVLDVGCGTGVVAVTAARLGAQVTGLNLTPALLERARENAHIAGVKIDWREAHQRTAPAGATVCRRSRLTSFCDIMLSTAQGTLGGDGEGSNSASMMDSNRTSPPSVTRRNSGNSCPGSACKLPTTRPSKNAYHVVPWRSTFSSR
jgi:SAM-dependent methyltransferase